MLGGAGYCPSTVCFVAKLLCFHRVQQSAGEEKGTSSAAKQRIPQGETSVESLHDMNG